MDKNVYTVFQDIFSVFWFYFKRVNLVPKQMWLLFVHLFGYILTIVAFIVFAVVNGSIVVGDKSAHEAAIHLPQVNKFGYIFYVSFLKEMLFHFST